MWYVYCLHSKEGNGYYIGSTGDLRRRLIEHHSGNCQTTSRMKVLKLVYYEASNSKADAMIREKQLKTGFGRAYLKRRLKNFLADLD